VVNAKEVIGLLEGVGYKTFVIKRGFRGGTAELSDMSLEIVSDTLGIEAKGNWSFFNRLVVPKELRGEGLATELMKQVTQWADKKKVNILNGVNPYGDLSLKQLIAFYGKFGFKAPNKKNPEILVRYHK